jgi:sphingomyelin phosphodiesterase
VLDATPCLKFSSLAAPERGPDLLVAHCNLTSLSSTCEATFGRRNLGAVITQVLANADVGGYDGQVGNQSVCQSFEVAYPLGLLSKFLRHVLPPSPVSPELDWMVCKTETKPTPTTKTCQRETAHSTSHL